MASQDDRCARHCGARMPSPLRSTERMIRAVTHHYRSEFRLRVLIASSDVARRHQFGLPRARAFLSAAIARGSPSSTSVGIAFFRSAQVAPV
jgi:hypothetical protein